MPLKTATVLRRAGRVKFCWGQFRRVHMLRDLPVPTGAELERWVVVVISLTAANRAWSRSNGSPRRLRHRNCRPLSAHPRHRLSAWTSPPRTMLLVQKVFDERVTVAMGGILK